MDILDESRTQPVRMSVTMATSQTAGYSSTARFQAVKSVAERAPTYLIAQNGTKLSVTAHLDQSRAAPALRVS